jgi:hypothetical protein
MIINDKIDIYDDIGISSVRNQNFKSNENNEINEIKDKEINEINEKRHRGYCYNCQIL